MGSYWPEFLKVAIAHMLAVMSPGPDFAVVLRQSLAHGRRTAVWTAIGIGSAICLHVTYSLCGLGLLLRSSPAAFTALKFAGAAYLAWMGVRALRAAPLSPLAERAGASAGGLPGAHSAWTIGFLTNALNPKAALFFIALFASLISPGTPLSVRVFYGGWISLTTMGWFSLVAMLFTQDRVRRAYLRSGHWIDRVLGVVFLVFAAGLVASSVR
jgi:RhtB (resistance to homoserine/threonine) family protein